MSKNFSTGKFKNTLRQGLVLRIKLIGCLRIQINHSHLKFNPAAPIYLFTKPYYLPFLLKIPDSFYGINGPPCIIWVE